jgi:hypothetical protein
MLFSIFFGKKTFLSRLLVLFNYVICIWGVGGFLFSQAKMQQEALPWIKMASIGVILSPVLFFHIVHVLCDLRNKTLLIGAYIIGLLFVVANLANLFITRVQLISGNLFYPVIDNFLFPTVFIFWIIIVCYAIYQLVSNFRITKGIKRNQILYFLLATAIGFFGGTLNFLPIFGIKFYPYSNFLVGVYSIVITYAILRYRLLDFKIALTRAGIFAVVYFPVAFIPFWVAPKFIHTRLWWVP